MSVQPGGVLLHYRLAEKIGEGGMGRVSRESAAMPRWAGDGRTLHFLTQDRRIFRATVAPGTSKPVLGLPEELFRTSYDGSYTARTSRWAVLPDGSGFLVLEAPPVRPLSRLRWCS